MRIDDDAHGLGPILGFTDEGHVGHEREERADALAHERVIVGKDDADHEADAFEGRCALTANARDGSDATRSQPPISSSRARIPDRPWPARSSLAPLPSSCASIVIAPSALTMVIQRFVACECLSALVDDLR